jgi:SAM and SH3 domain-containing protein 1
MLLPFSEGKHQIEYPPSIGQARALVDCVPSPYDKESLRFKKGDIIDIISMNVSGNWKGFAHGRIGTFKFINVELISAAPGPIGPVAAPRRSSRSHRTAKPQNVEELLRRVNLEVSFV